MNRWTDLALLAGQAPGDDVADLLERADRVLARAEDDQPTIAVRALIAATIEKAEEHECASPEPLTGPEWQTLGRDLVALTASRAVLEAAGGATLALTGRSERIDGPSVIARTQRIAAALEADYWFCEGAREALAACKAAGEAALKATTPAPASTPAPTPTKRARAAKGGAK